MVRYIFLFVLMVLPVQAQWNEEDVKICDKVLNWTVKPGKGVQSVPGLITTIGKSFLGTEYVAHTLEAPGEEQLVVNLRGLDCTTFLENALVFARCIKKGKTEFDDYTAELTFIRYRDGKINGYPSRLHYFSDWIYDNVKKGVVKDVTKEIGGVKTKFNVGIMTARTDLYPQLKENKKFVSEMKKYEKEINSREYWYIPKKNIEKAESGIQDGDLIAITSNIDGLDINHIGIAYKKDGRIYFMHAPNVGHKVQITKEPLADYIADTKKHTGIIVLRAVDIPKE